MGSCCARRRSRDDVDPDRVVRAFARAAERALAESEDESEGWYEWGPGERRDHAGYSEYREARRWALDETDDEPGPSPSRPCCDDQGCAVNPATRRRVQRTYSGAFGEPAGASVAED